MNAAITLDEARRRIRAVPRLNAFISLTSERGDGPVVAVKDNIDVAGAVTTGGGVCLPKEPAGIDATIVARLRASGTVVVGKTNLNEWALGATGENVHFGPVRNPRDERRMAGGSSSGSAVAVAARLSDVALGTDTAGSIRIPAALCGVVGFKPTLGLLPTDGIFPVSSTLDTVGVLACDVEHVSWFLAQATGQPAPDGRRKRPAGGLRLAVPAGWVDGLDSQVATAWESVAGRLPEIPFPGRARLGDLAATILAFEVAALHAVWLRDGPERYGPDVRARLEAASAVGEAAYRAALDARLACIEAVDRVMDDLDAILLPATSCVAPLLGAVGVQDQLTRFSRPVSLTGMPVLCLPAPVGAGLPVGIQVIGGRGADRVLIEIGRALEDEWSAGGHRISA